MTVHIVGLTAQGPLVAFHRPVQIARILQHDAQIVQGIGIIGTQFDGRAEILDGQIGLVLGFISQGQIVIDIRLAGGKFQGRVKAGDGVVQPPQIPVHAAQRIVHLGIGRVSVTGVFINRAGLFQLPQHPERIGQIDPRLGKMGVQIHRPLKRLRRFRRAALGAQHGSQIVVGIGPLRRQDRHLGVKFQGFVHLALGFQRIGQIEQMPVRLGSQRHHLPKADNGPVHITGQA